MGYNKVGIRWNEEKIERAIRKVVSAYELDRMPSRSECEKYYGNTALTNAVSRRCGGWYKLASDLNLPIKKSETGLGKKYELVAEALLRKSGFDVIRMSQNFPYDLLVDRCVKVDVKVSHLYEGKNGRFYSFGIEKDFATCDCYILFCIDDNDALQKVYVVPSVIVVSNSQISIGEHTSKYDIYLNKWEYLRKIASFWKTLQEQICSEGNFA